MRLRIASDEVELATLAADAVVEALRSDDPPVLGVATGSSPRGVYAELARRVADGQLDLRGASAFALDEYVGLPASHRQAYRFVVHEQVTVPLDLDPSRVHVPDGTATDLDAAASSFELRMREAGGVDVQLLGIGRNGHIGFNEPGAAFDTRTREAQLADETIADNARFFGSEAEVPRRCLTQGIGTILEAGRIVLVAQGDRKAEAIRHLLESASTTAWPATALQLHPDVSVIVDDAAASALRAATRALAG